MQSTGHLTMMGDFGLPGNVLVLHPNDGYDLGLLASHNPLRVFLGVSLEDFEAGKGVSAGGSLHLKNDCTPTTLRINMVWWRMLGKPRGARLVAGDGKLLIKPE